MEWKHCLPSAFAIVVLGLAIYFCVMAARDFKKNFPRYKGIWKSMESFERHLFNGGLWLFFAIPIVKNHKSGDVYLVQVLTEILPALASGMFLAGIIAFIRELHKYDSSTSIVSDT